MDKDILSAIVCPKCKENLTKIDSYLKCSKCGDEFKIFDNILYLKKLKGFYYSEYSASVDKQRKMIKDLENIKELHTFVAINQLHSSSYFSISHCLS